MSKADGIGLAERAFEMRAMGMRGFGRAHEELFKRESFQDGESAQLRSTESLIHVREALWLLARQGRINPSMAHLLIDQFKSM